MTWPELSIEDFPPRRDDEPSSLRQDIIDELSDHFACALNRELLKNPDEQVARRRVLEQFGDPIKVARQLWLEAMKEKIMSQRILTGVSVVMAACCIAVVVFSWLLIKESQTVNARMLEQLTAIADRPVPVTTGDVDEQILKQLETINQNQSSLVNTSGIGMNQVSFQLIEGQNDQKPAVGFKGTLTKSGGKTDPFSIEAVSNEKGRLDFGKLPWGTYYLYVYSPWNESYHKSQVTIIPGRDYLETINCPAAPPREVAIHFNVNLSEKMLPEDRVLVCDFRQTRSMGVVMERDNYYFSSTRMAGDCSWRLAQDRPMSPSGVYLVDSSNQVSACPLTSRGEFESIRPDSIVFKPAVNFTQGNYCLPVMYLVRKQDLSRLNEVNTARAYPIVKNKRPGTLLFNPNSGSQRAGSEYFAGGSRAEFRTTVVLIPFNDQTETYDPKKSVSLLEYISHNKHLEGLELKQTLNYSAKPDQKNIWEINLSELDKAFEK
ncbi:MAG: hypothetical protein CME32_27000 [Gimesia sp.]|nr:hypothetical protein [Gimesia sp.]